MTEKIPRPEYPRPEAKRDDWLCLNGAWKFEFDPDHVGMKEKWYEASSEKLTKEIIVPFVFQSELSGINSQAFVDTVWYGKEITIPKTFQGKNILLHFGAVDYECEVFVNGAYVGNHSGGVTPFKFSITDYLSDNLDDPQYIAVKVFDPPFDPSIPRGKQTTKEFLDGCSYEKSLGIWQTVWLEPVASTYLDRSDYYIRCNMDTGKIETSISINGLLGKEHVIEAQAFDGETPITCLLC